jgi:anthranilate 1,2-dioxygenase large subunit
METQQNGWQPISWPAKFNHVPKEVFVRQDVYDEEIKRIFYGPAWHVSAMQAKSRTRAISRSS